MDGLALLQGQLDDCAMMLLRPNGTEEELIEDAEVIDGKLEFSVRKPDLQYRLIKWRLTKISYRLIIVHLTANTYLDEEPLARISRC